MRTSPGAVRLGAGGWAQPSAIRRAPSRGLSGSMRTRPAAISRTARGSSLCSTSWKCCSDRRDVSMVRKLERLLQDDRPAVHALVDEVDGHAGHLDPVLERLLDRAEPGKGRQQRGVHVQDPPAKRRTNAGVSSSMKPASTTSSTPRSSSQSASASSRCSRSGSSASANTAVSTPAASARSSPRASARLRRHRRRPRCRRSRGPVEQRLEVRALAGDEYGDREAHAGDAQHRVGPAGRLEATRSISSSTRARMSARRMCEERRTPAARRRSCAGSSCCASRAGSPRRSCGPPPAARPPPRR